MGSKKSLLRNRWSLVQVHLLEVVAWPTAQAMAYENCLRLAAAGGGEAIRVVDLETGFSLFPSQRLCPWKIHGRG